MRITREQALDRVRQNINGGVAVNRVMSRGVAQLGDNLEIVRAIKSQDVERLYLIKDNDTITVTPADDQLPAVLAEFDTDDDVNLNPVVIDWLIDTAEQVRIAQAMGYVAPVQESSSNEGAMDTEGEGEGEGEGEEETPTLEYIAPLLGGIAWLQGDPFNRYLNFTIKESPKPEEIGTKKYCLVGCPATAAAQVVCYLGKHNIYKVGCIKTPAFISNKISGYKCSVPKTERCPKFKYSQMLDTYSHMDSGNHIITDEFTEAQADAAAELCAYISMAGKTFYSPKASGMELDTQLQPALKYGLGIDCKAYTPGNSFSSVDIDRIKDSLRKEMPVIMSGIKGDNGHAFVCDGYREIDDTFHFNWGYGPARSNGWFKMVTFNPVEVDDGHPEKYKSYTTWANNRCYIVITPPDPLRFDINKDGLINMLDVNILIQMNIDTDIPVISTVCKKATGASIRPVWKGSARPTNHDYIDFHLPSGTLWATCNIGAADENAYGAYIGWRRTASSSAYQYDEELDSDFVVTDIADTAQDAAKANWGSGWQMPSIADFEELKEWCDFDVTADKTVTSYVGSDGKVHVIEVINRYVEVSRKRRKYTEEEQAYYDQTGNRPDIPDGVILLPLAGSKWNKTTYDKDLKGIYWTSQNGMEKDGEYYAEAIDISFHIPEKVTYNGVEYDTMALADLNYDGVIDNQDVQMIIDRILGN